MPVLGTDRNLDMKYYKDMEEYEIISRKVLRKRIKRMLVVIENKKFELKQKLIILPLIFIF